MKITFKIEIETPPDYTKDDKVAYQGGVLDAIKSTFDEHHKVAISEVKRRFVPSVLPVTNCELLSCGKAFLPTREWQKYCCQDHQERAYFDRVKIQTTRKEHGHICAHCQKVFECTNEEWSQTKPYCVACWAKTPEGYASSGVIQPTEAEIEEIRKENEAFMNSVTAKPLSPESGQDGEGKQLVKTK